jgi:hypothetical protein
MAKKRVKRGYFSKVSTGEIPVFTGPVDFLNRSGLVPVQSGRTGSSSGADCTYFYNILVTQPIGVS